MASSRGWYLAAVVVALAVAGCARAESATDGPTWSTVHDLAADADVVVRGEIGAVRGSEVDAGGNADPDVGPVVIFVDLHVTQVISGTMAGVTVPVGWSDPGAGDSSRELVEGDDVVLFLEQLTVAEAPGIDTESSFYVVLGSDQGVFDVEGSTVTARSTFLESLDGETSGSVGIAPLSASLDELVAVVKAVAQVG